MARILGASIQQFARAMTSLRLMQKQPSVPGTASDSARRQFVLGLLLLMVVVFLWTLSNFVTQALFQDGYDKPFLVTYMNTSAFSLYLLIFLWRQKGSVRGADLNTENIPGNDYRQLVTQPDRENELINETIIPVPLFNDSQPLTMRETAHLAFQFCFLWFMANWAVNASLNYTSVASATVLSSMSGFFTLGIGRIFLVEALTLGKVTAVFMSFMGVLMVSISDSRSPGTPNQEPILGEVPEHSYRALLGDTLALLSAIFYALYVILLKVRIRMESRVDMQLFFGFVGLFNILLCWPLGIALHFAGVEIFELPTTTRAVIAILINMFITLSSDYIYVLAMLKTTPLVVTIGLSLTIPLAVFGDFIMGKLTNGQVLAGAVLVLISFIIVGLDDMYIVVI